MSKRLSILKQPVLSVINDHLVDYPTPSNINYFWGFGSSAGICLMIQIATGIFLAMHYTPNVDLAFLSVEHIMRDVSGGWLLRYMHANGASMFFIVVYIHVFRGLYYGSYASPREALWCIGVVILLLMIATAFIGYVLPWGQMSFWGATVITSLASAIPVVGDQIVTWLWGGFSVNIAASMCNHTMKNSSLCVELPQVYCAFFKCPPPAGGGSCYGWTIRRGLHKRLSESKRRVSSMVLADGQ